MQVMVTLPDLPYFPFHKFMGVPVRVGVGGQQIGRVISVYRGQDGHFHATIEVEDEAAKRRLQRRSPDVTFGPFSIGKSKPGNG